MHKINTETLTHKSLQLRHTQILAAALAIVGVLNGCSKINHDFPDASATLDATGALASVNTKAAKSLSISGPNLIASGACSASFRVVVMDQDGQPTITTGTLNVTLGDAAAGAFYSDPLCSSPLSSSVASLPKGSSGSTIYYKSSTSGAVTVSVAAQGLNTGGANVLVSRAPTQLMLLGPTSFTTGACSPPISVVVADASNNAATPSSALTVNLSGSGAGAFYTDSNCTGTAQTSLSIAAGTSAGSIFFKDGTSESLALSASATSLTTGTLGVSVAAAMGTIPTHFAISGPNAIASGSCSVFSVLTQNASGVPVAATAPTTVTLTGKGSGTFYANSTCTGSTTTATVNAGSSSAVFYYSNATPEAETFSGTSGIMIPIGLGVTVSSSAAALAISGQNSLSTGTCSGSFTLSTRDSTGQPAPLTSTKAVTLSGSGAGSFYSDSACSGATITSFSLLSSQSSRVFYFKDASAESLTLAAAAGGLSSASFSLATTTASGGAPAKFGITGSNSVAAGACTAYTVSTLTNTNTPLAANALTTITLSGAGGGAFYSESTCGTLTTTVAITSGTTAALVYYKDAGAEAVTLSGTSSPVLTAVSQPVTVNALPTKYQILGGGALLNPTTCSGAYTVVAQDTTSKPANLTTSTVVNLTGGGAGNFYADSSCTGSTVTSLTFSPGTSSMVFYFKDASTENLTLTAGDGSRTPASTSLSVATVAGSPTQFSITGSSSIATSTCTPYTILTLDGSSAIRSVTSTTTITLSGNGSGGFYSDSSCLSSATTATINSGVSSGLFYYKNATAESRTLSGAASPALAAGNLGVVTSGCAAVAPYTVASPGGGNINAANQVVTLTPYGGTTPVTTYYTTDGSAPSTASTQYSPPMTLSGTITLKFFSKDACNNSESIQSKSFVIATSVTPTTTASVNGGLYFLPKKVTLNGGVGNTTYYTTDGSTPTTSSTTYTSPLSIFTEFTAKFFSVNPFGVAESVVSKSYRWICAGLLPQQICTVAGRLNLQYEEGGVGDLWFTGRPSLLTLNPTSGEIYFSDPATHTIRKIDPTAGTVVRIAGTPETSGYSGDGGKAINAKLYNPGGLRYALIGGVNYLFFADSYNHVVRLINLDTGIISRFAGIGVGGAGYDGGTATFSALYYPSDVEWDAARNKLYIADYQNHQIRQVDWTTRSFTTLAGVGWNTGSGNSSGLSGESNSATNTKLGSNIAAVRFDPSGNWYVVDGTNNRIIKVDGTTGKTSVYAGDVYGTSGYSGDGSAATGAFLSGPTDLVFDSSGNGYIADYSNHVVRKVDTSGIISTYAGSNANWSAAFPGNGSLKTADNTLNYPRALAIDGSSNLYISDTNRYVIYKITGATISIYAGTGTPTYTAGQNGGLATSANIGQVYGMVHDGSTRLFLSDNYQYVIRYVSSSDSKIYLLAGTGSSSNPGVTNGAAATTSPLYSPGQISLNGTKLYYADYYSCNIRRFDLNTVPTPITATVTRVAGSNTGTCTAGTPDAVATAGTIYYPRGVHALANGEVYYTSDGRIWKIDTQGSPHMQFTAGYYDPTSTSYVINGWAGVGGIATLSEFTNPKYLALDSANNFLYVADYNNRLRRIDLSATPATILTVVGTGANTSVDNATALLATTSSSSVTGISINSSGAVYISEYFAIRKYTPGAGVATIAGMLGTSSTTLTTTTPGAVRFSSTTGHAIPSPDGGIYYGDPGTGVIWKANPAVTSISVFAGSGASSNYYSGDTDTPSYSTFNVNGQNYPHLAFDTSGNLYFSSRGGGTIRKYTMGATPRVDRVAGSAATASYTASGVAKNITMNQPAGLSVASNGDIYVGDPGDHVVRKISGGTMTTYAGIGTSGAFTPTPANPTALSIYYPVAAQIQTNGDLLVSDNYYNAVWRITSGGAVTRVAGSTGASGDGNNVTANTSDCLMQPEQIRQDSLGNVYINDAGNKKLKVVKTDGKIYTLSGAPFGGTNNWFKDFVLKDDDTIYALIYPNPALYKYTVSTNLFTLISGAGRGSFDTGDYGNAIDASFAPSTGLALDPDGNLFFTTSNSYLRAILSPP